MTDVLLREIQARLICDGKFGAGHFDKPTTKRGHWRRLAEENTGELDLRERPQAPSIGARLWRWYARGLGVTE